MPAASKVLTSAGEYAWGGLASTAFYVDPRRTLTAMFFTQLMPSSTYPIRSQLRTLVNQARGRLMPTAARRSSIRVVVIAVVAVGGAPLLVDGIELGGGTTGARIGTLLVVALIFGVVNAVLKPLIKTVGCAFYLLTLGLIGLVVNALLFLLVGWLSPAARAAVRGRRVLGGVLGRDRRGGRRLRAAPDHPGPPRRALSVALTPATPRSGSRRPRTSTRSGTSW